MNTQIEIETETRLYTYRHLCCSLCWFPHFHSPGHGDCIHIGRAQVGIITSGCLSSTLGKNIALCRIDVGHSEIGTKVEIGKIDGHQKRIPAKIVGFPHYDPKKSRFRS